MIFGYARVSTSDQNLDLQLDALNKEGCEKIFADKISGKTTNRPELDKLLEQLRPGDKVVVYKLDRLGRSLKHLIEQVEDFKKKQIEFESIQEKIDTTSPTGNLIFHLFGAIAEFERGIIRERIKAGMEAGRARGKAGGRPSKLTEQQIKQLKKLYEDKNIPIRDLCEMFKTTKTSLYRYLNQ